MDTFIYYLTHLQIAPLIHYGLLTLWLWYGIRWVQFRTFPPGEGGVITNAMWHDRHVKIWRSRNRFAGTFTVWLLFFFLTTL